MGSIFTAIGKILNIKFLLIFLSVITFLDIYFTVILHKELIEHYKEILNFKSILQLTLIYLISINILIPMLGLIFGIIFWIISFIGIRHDDNIIVKIFSALYNQELEELFYIRDKAIEENNSAKMKMFELNLEEYKEMHSIYLFSFFNLILFIICLINYSSDNGIVLLELYNLIIQTDESRSSEFINIFFVYIPLFIFGLYSFKYITSFNIYKFEQWIKIHK